MRPVGSMNGRIPAGGYPELSSYFAGLLAGLIEAEGSFVIAKQTRGYAYRPTMSLAMRADDRTLLDAVLRHTKLGSVVETPARRTSHAQVRWHVTAKADCVRLVHILDDSRLRGKKTAEYSIWRAAVLRWTRGGAGARLKPDDWAPFELWKHELEEAKRYREPTSRTAHRAQTFRSGEWEPYLAGFATGEGCFHVEKRGVPRFTIRLRADDMPLLVGLRDATRAGRVYGPYDPTAKQRHPSAMWTVSSREETDRLVEILDRSPVAGRKRLEYGAWRSAVLERSRGAGWSGERVRQAREFLMQLRSPNWLGGLESS